MEQTERSLKAFSLILLTVAVGMGIWAGQAKTLLVHEGTTKLYMMFDTQRPFYFNEFWREFELLWQVPSVLVLKMFGRDGMGLALEIASFVYALKVLVPWIFCFWYLEKKRSLGLLVFPIVSYAVADLSTHPYPMGLAGNASVVFWPTFMVMWLRREGWGWEWFLGLILLITLAFTYESVVLAYPFLLLIGINRLRKSRGKPWDEWTMLFVTVGLGIWSAVRLRRPGAMGTADFSSLKGWLSYIGIYGWLFFFCLLVVLISLRFKIVVSVILQILVGVVIGWAVWSWVYPDLIQEHLFSNYFNSRLTSFPTALTIAIVCFLFGPRLLPRLNQSFFARVSAMIWVLVLFLFGSGYYGFSINRISKWHSQVGAMIESQGDVCRFWSGSEYMDTMGPDLGTVHNFHFTSILLQKTYSPQKVLFVAEEDRQGTDYCREIKRGPVAPGFAEFDFSKTQAFDFSAFLKEVP